MTLNTSELTAPISPALIASALDCLAVIPTNSRLDAALMTAVAREIGCCEAATPTLIIRMRAAAIVFCDPRWSAWSTYFKSCGPDARIAIDAVIVTAIAELPLTAAFRFDPDRFFSALLDQTPSVRRS